MIRILSRITLLLALLISPAQVHDFCHELDVVQGKIFRAAAIAAPAVTIEWFGHSTFQLTSSKGTRVLTDPHGAYDLPRQRCRNISSPPAISTARTTAFTWRPARR
jgi:hypothetical protein